MIRLKGAGYWVVAFLFTIFVLFWPDGVTWRQPGVLRLFSAGVAVGILLTHGAATVFRR